MKDYSANVNYLRFLNWFSFLIDRVILFSGQNDKIQCQTKVEEKMFFTAFGWLMLHSNCGLQVHQQKTVEDAHFAANNLILVTEACQI